MSEAQRLSSFFRDCRTICGRKSPHSSSMRTERTHIIPWSGLGFLVCSPYRTGTRVFRTAEPHEFACTRARFPCVFLLPVSCCLLCHCVAKHRNCTMWRSKLAEPSETSGRFFQCLTRTHKSLEGILALGASPENIWVAWGMPWNPGARLLLHGQWVIHGPYVGDELRLQVWAWRCCLAACKHLTKTR